MFKKHLLAINILIISYLFFNFSFSINTGLAYDSPSSNASTTIDYTYTKSFESSSSQDLTFNFTLKQIFNVILINASPYVDSNSNPFSLKFVQNNTLVTLQRSNVFADGGTYTLFTTYFSPESSNADIIITSVSGFTLKVTITIIGYKNLSTSQEIQSLDDASNNKSAPTNYQVQYNTTFYGVLTKTDIHDYYQFSFPKSIKFNIQITIVQPVTEILDIYTGYSISVGSIASEYQFSGTNPVNQTFTTKNITVGISYPNTNNENSTTTIYIYKITILSSYFDQTPTNQTSSLQSNSESGIGPASGFEYFSIISIVLIPLIGKKKRK